VSEVPAAYLEQYKLAVEMADRISARRATANGFFLTVQATLVALLGVKGIDSDWIAAAGILLSLTWFLLLRSYRDLNAAKFRVIGDIETKLPIAVFADEWKYLKEDPVKPWRPRYAELGLIERLVPVVFGAIFLVTVIS
jgi:hypothetical protein